jgi:hypothetical protein
MAKTMRQVITPIFPAGARMAALTGVVIALSHARQEGNSP